jgi:lysophospholipase L1-like esterase
MIGPVVARVARTRAVAAALGAVSATALVCEQMRRIVRARQRGKETLPAFRHTPDEATQHVLVIGDSTGAGIGCKDSAESIAGRIANDFVHTEIENVSVSGATVAEVLRQLSDPPPERRFELVLVFAGGNDVIRRTSHGDLCRSVRDLLKRLQASGSQVIWVGVANVGLVPAFLPPLSWLLTYKTRCVNRLLADEVALHGGCFVDLFYERGVDPFSAEAELYYADDGVHPSAHAYAYCYEKLKPHISEALGLLCGASVSTSPLRPMCAGRS